MSEETELLEELTQLQAEERIAMTNSHAGMSVMSVMRVIGALRSYRVAVRRLLNDRYRDGTCDAVSVHVLANAVAEIEELS